MLPFITEKIPEPWSERDLKEFELNGSQRDNVLYLPSIDARFILSEENIYQCSIRVNANKYKNIYLFALTRNQFAIIIFIPQMYVLQKVKDNEIVSQCIQRTLLTKNILSSTNDNSLDLANELNFSEGNCIILKVNTSIDSFLFPRRGVITNQELIDKYNQLNLYYARVVKEYETIVGCVSQYSDSLQKQIQEREKRIKKILIRKGVRVGVSLAITAVSGMYVDLDNILGFEDVADLSDIMDMADTSEIMDIGAFDIDWDTSDDAICSLDNSELGAYNHDTPEYHDYINQNIHHDVDESSSISFMGKDSLPQDSNSDGFIANGTITLHRDGGSDVTDSFKLYTKGGNNYVLYNKKYIHLTGKFVKIAGISYKLS